MAAYRQVSTQTLNHSITITDGTLTITGEQKTLTSDETLLLLEVLLIWQYGLEVVVPNEREDDRSGAD